MVHTGGLQQVCQQWQHDGDPRRQHDAKVVTLDLHNNGARLSDHSDVSALTAAHHDFQHGDDQHGRFVDRMIQQVITETNELNQQEAMEVEAPTNVELGNALVANNNA